MGLGGFEPPTNRFPSMISVDHSNQTELQARKKNERPRPEWRELNKNLILLELVILTKLRKLILKFMVSNYTGNSFVAYQLIRFTC
jgi:hypothetical protein